MGVTVYVLTFDAQWLEDGRVVRGEHAYPVTAPMGEFDMASAIAACQIVAASSGAILFPENQVLVNTFVWDLEDAVPPLWDDGEVRVY